MHDDENLSGRLARLRIGRLAIVVIATIGRTFFIASAGAESPTQSTAEPAVKVTWQRVDETEVSIGRVVVSDRAGGMLLESSAGAQTIIEATKVLQAEVAVENFRPLTPDELGEQLLAELPDGFQVYTTPHYVIAYDTSLTYAKWTSSLLERLHRAFTGYWSTKGFELTKPEFPLPVVVYASRDQYRSASKSELGGAAGSVIGYYSLATNRVNMYDLTGAEAGRADRNERASFKTINHMLAQPTAVPLVATIVHEATHQVAFNCGLHSRFADVPLWLIEGMAVYFEAPDLTSSRGWTGVGKVNYPRLEVFRGHLAQWKSEEFQELITGSTRLRNPATALDAYADAWALNYYLIRYRPDGYVSYLEAQRQKSPLATTTADEKRAEFEQHFGALKDLEPDFLRRMSRHE